MAAAGAQGPVRASMCDAAKVSLDQKSSGGLSNFNLHAAGSVQKD